MILVDTSVLVDFLAGRETAAASCFEGLVTEEAVFCITPVVLQEVLQGARDLKEWRTLERYLGSQAMAHVSDPTATAVAAAKIFYDCRRRGLTVRSTVDCLIAQIALDAGYPLLHSDRDFELIQRVRPLRTLP